MEATIYAYRHTPQSIHSIVNIYSFYDLAVTFPAPSVINIVNIK